LTTPESNGPQGIAALEQVRREQARRIVWLVAAFVIVPTLTAGIYYGIVATREYTSRASFTIDTGAGGPPGPNLPLPGTDVGRDSLIVRDHLRSRDVLRGLIDRHRFRETYQASWIDRLSRLPDGASSDATYDYYLDRVYIDLDAETGFVVVEVRAFSPSAAHSIAAALVAAAEQQLDAVDAALGDGASRHLVHIASPSLPDRPSGPNVWREVLTWLLGTAAVLIIGWVLVATAREHAI
jgi:capsular polysaccharide transport system permease protein